MNTKSFKLSIALHLSLIVVASVAARRCGTGNGTGTGDCTGDNCTDTSQGSEGFAGNDTKVIPKIQVVEVPQNILEGIAELDAQVARERKRLHLDDGCENYYGGIGILVSKISQPDGSTVYMILEVYDGYPAQELGLKVGDIIVDYDILMGQIEEQISFRAIQNGSVRTFTTKRAKICTEPKS